MYLADFGITKYMGRRTGLTVAGTVLGTVHYVSPEQIQDRAVRGPADQYALGCVLYECLTGRAPFEKNSNEALMWAHVHELAAPPSLLRPDLPPAVDEVIARALAKNPGERYADCREFLAAARDALAPAATRPQFLPAPVPSGGLRDLDRGPAPAPGSPPRACFPPGQPIRGRALDAGSGGAGPSAALSAAARGTC